MSITATGGNVVVEFAESNVSGKPALGGYLLRFSLNYVMPAWGEKSFQFANISAKVLIGEARLLIGWAIPEIAITFISKPHIQNSALLFDIYLTSQMMENIEELRAGGDIQLFLDIRGEVIDEYNRLPRNDSIAFNVNQKSWIEILKQMKYGNYLLYELPIDLEPDDRTLAAIKELEKAKKHLYYGNYDEVVAACRIALETIMPNRKIVNRIRLLIKDNRRLMNKYERYINLIDSIVHLSHLAHHPNDDDLELPFTRKEALFVLGITASAISSCQSMKIS